MSTYHQLWYVKHGDSVAGPFPPQVISRHLLLGRIFPTDQVSPDKVNWLPLTDFPELQPNASPPQADSDPESRAWQDERTKASRRWAEERLSPEPLQALEEGERRHAGESFEDLAFRQHHAEVRQSLIKGTPRIGWAAAAFVVFALAVATAAVLYSPVNPVKVGLPPPVPDCGQTAAPEINWSECDKQGTWLTGVDLTSANLNRTRFNSAQLGKANLAYAALQGADFSFANLTGARLISADLQNADLSHAELRDADLQYADLRGARLGEASLEGAVLDHATWHDGRVCATGSIGQCL